MSEPVAWMVGFERKLGGAIVPDRLLVWQECDAAKQVREELIRKVEPLYTAEEIERNRAAIAELVDALEGAKEMVCEWGAYADYKSQAKWDLIGDIAKLERTIKKYQNPTKELK